jgi:type 1 glutamine amidotransferase
MPHGQFTRHEVLRLGGAALATITLPGLLRAEAPTQPGRPGKNLLFFTKSAEYEHDIVRRDDGRLGTAETTLIRLGTEHGVTVTASKDGTVFDRDIERYDAFVFFTTGDLTTPGEDRQPPMSPGGKAALLRAIKAGKGFVGIHCASDTFHSAGERYQTQEHRDPYIDMLGGEFITHGEQQPARLRVVDTGFPGMHLAGDGVVLYEEWYSLKNFAPDVHVILVLETAGMHGPEYQRPPYPATWARRHGAGRVFYTCLGHRADVWAHPLFQAMLIGAMTWVLGKVDADISPNLPQVTPAAHTMPPQ